MKSESIVSFTFDDILASSFICGQSVLDVHNLKDTFYGANSFFNSKPDHNNLEITMKIKQSMV